MNGTIADCARAALVHEATKRLHAGQPVEWFEDGHRYRAVPNDSKYEGAWLVTGNHWERYMPRERVEEALRSAEGIPFEVRP